MALGGGHGLASSLRAIRRYAGQVTAIVSVADDGGSSGRLRQELGMPPPGDARRCLVALADDAARDAGASGALWARAFELRFDAGGFEGHAFGNLVIAGLAEVCTDFVTALDEAGRLVGAVGRVLPATTHAVTLEAEAAGRTVEGQVAVTRATGVSGVSLVPPDARPPEAALEALAGADQVVVGPGSLFTSLLAVIAVPALRHALAATTARKVYVCNLREQVSETTGYDVAAHVAALRAHGFEPDVVVCHPGAMAVGALDLERIEAPVARPGRSAHDPELLGLVLADLLP